MYAFIEGFKILGLSAATLASVSAVGVVLVNVEKMPFVQFLFG